MKRIEKLTKAQKARFNEWADKWIEIGLRTGPADRPKFEQAVRECYRFAGLEPPKVIVWTTSPLVVSLAGPIAALLIEFHRKGKLSVHDAVGDAVGDAVRGAVGDAVGDAVGQVLANAWSNYFGGQFWVGGYWWGGAWTSYFREVCGLELKGDLWDRAKAYEATLESASHLYPHRDFVIVSERPTCIHTELADPAKPRGWNSHRLYCEDGPAVGFQDGWGVWAWHGVRVTKQIIENPDTLTVEQIKNEENAEVRRIMIERMGWDTFCAKAQMRVIHVDELHSHFPAIPVSELVEEGSRLVVSYRDGTERAQLLEADGLTDFEERPLRFVRLTDPSTGREYTIRVKHSHTRCYEAVGWTFGLTETEYKRGRYIRQGDVFLQPIEGGPLEQQHS
jgi:hypothetical protein